MFSLTMKTTSNEPLIIKIHFLKSSHKLAAEVYYSCITLLCHQMADSAPQSKTQYLHLRSHAEHFLLPWKIPEAISR